MPLDTYDNDAKQAKLTFVLLAIMSVVAAVLIVASVLSTRACTV